MDFRQLSYVVGVVDHGGFTRAAEALGVSQPTLSQGVQSLEAELGVVVFHRVGRRVVLTSAGEALMGPARQALRDAATIRAATSDVAGLRSGRLDVVCLPTLAVDPVARLVGDFRRQHPGIAVRLADPDEARSVTDRVRDGSSEIGITELPLEGEDLQAHRLDVQDYVAVLFPQSGAERVNGRISLRALARQPLITTPSGTSTRRVLDEAFATAGLKPVVSVETDHREAIGPLVASGAGVSLLPRAVAAGAVRSGAVLREVTPRVRREIGLIHRRTPLSPPAQAFVELVGGAAPPTARPRPRRR